jgi:hypothetical protein
MILIGSELVKKFPDWVEMRKDENLRIRYYGKKNKIGNIAKKYILQIIFCI